MVRKNNEEDKGMKPASNPENREKQLIALAVNLAEKQLREGTASPSVINHYLKLGSTREALEHEILEKQKRLIDAKADSIVKVKEQEELTKAALDAFKNYNSSSN
jgi:EAL domain-containing protein (putative c-di-GMP-specific phosphodiesterase class I)